MVPLLNKIIVGDCRVVALPSASFDCIIADPPYMDTSLKWDSWPTGWPDRMIELLKPSGSMWCFGSFRMFWRFRDQFSAWKIAQEVIWEKQNGSGMAVDRFRRVHEIAVHFYPKKTPWSAVYKNPLYTFGHKPYSVKRKGKPQHWGSLLAPINETINTDGRRLQRSVIRLNSQQRKTIHPTQKPVDLVQMLLAYSCPSGGHVLSPFLGGGTDAIAAKLQECSCTGIETDEHMAALASCRMIEAGCY